jgi:hypothetical protein
MMLKSMRAKDGPKTVADDPSLVSSWSPKNGDVQPDQVTYRSRRTVWWRCAASDEHEWQAAPSAMKGCPFCAEARTENASPESSDMPKASIPPPPMTPTVPPAPPTPSGAPQAHASRASQSAHAPQTAARTAQPAPAAAPPSATPDLRALPIDLDMVEEAFCDGALCFLSPLTGEVFLPRKWRDDCPGYVRVPNADRRAWIPAFIANYVTDPRRQAVLRDAAATNEFTQRLDEREEVQWSAYSAARCGIEIRRWLEGLGIRVIPRRSGRSR